ncbi:MAG: J domain-containing protein, partial [Lysobacteraceae bacterium]
MPTAFHLLGLAPDADERAIKRAYAARLKTVRPDEDPEGFQRLNEAYQAALAWRQRHPPGDDDGAAAAIADRMEAAEERLTGPLPLVPVDDDASTGAAADAPPAWPPPVRTPAPPRMPQPDMP